MTHSHTSTSRRRWYGAGALFAVGALSSSVVLPPISASAAPTPGLGAAGALILADTDRDGTITAADAADRDRWTKESGAFFLANLDDDLQACPTLAPDGSQLSDVALAACNDGADRVINGDADTEDLARIQVQPAVAGADAMRVELRGVGAAKVNVFVNGGSGASAADWTKLPAAGKLPDSALSSGVELGIEGRDIIRDASWDGTVSIHVTHLDEGKKVASDSIELRVAPVLFATDIMPMEKLYAADNETSVYEGQATVPVNQNRVDTQTPFRADLEAGIERIGGDVELELLPSMNGARGGGTGTDIWTQDIMEPGFMSIPSPDGEQSMRLWVRAPVRDGRDNAGVNPFRGTGRVVFTELRGPDVAAVQHFDPNYVPVQHPGSSYDTYGSTGNYGTIPAHETAEESFPLGRKIFGSAAGGFTADPAYNAMLQAQGFQDPVVVDTSWLGVGHIDEFVSFIPADTELGWAMVLADPRLGYDLLKDLVAEGRGGEQLLQPYGFTPETVTWPTTTIAQTVEDENFVKGASIAAAGINKALKVIKAETGISESDIIRVPVLYRGTSRVGVGLPNAANLIGTGHDVVLIAKQHAPAVDGRDLFETLIEERFAEVGTEIQWVEDYRYAHPSGEIHCTTNVVRDHSFGESWWTEGAAADPVPGVVAPPTVAQLRLIMDPSARGKLRAGRTIKVVPGVYSVTPDSVRYEFLVGQKLVRTSAKPKLKLKAAYVGKKVRVRITAVKAGFAPMTTVTRIGTKVKK